MLHLLDAQNLKCKVRSHCVQVRPVRLFEVGILPRSRVAKPVVQHCGPLHLSKTPSQKPVVLISPSSKPSPVNTMSLPRKHDPTSYDESEETVPLYTEREDGPAIGDFDDIESGVELTSLPDEKATADEVREFFVRLLLSSRCNFSLDNARRTAAMWQAGSGREVKSYPAAMYLDLFGKEKGWIIYKEVFVLSQRKQPGKMTFTMKCCKFS